MVHAGKKAAYWNVAGLLAALLLPLSSLLHASPFFDPEAGFPLIRQFRPIDYKGHPQVHALINGPEGTILLGSANGILEFDGTRWSHVRADVSTIFHLSPGAGGRIYAGGDNSLGYFIKDSGSNWSYRDLMKHFPSDAAPLGRVLLQASTTEGLFLANRRTAFIWDGKSIQQLKEWGHAPRFHTLGDRLYVLLKDRGLYQRKDGNLVLVSDDAAFHEPHPFLPARLPDGRLLIFTGNRGTWAIDEATGRTTAHETPADKILQKNRFEDILPIPGIGWAITTFGGGVVVLSEDTRRIRVLDRTVGLFDNVAFDIALDREGGLWIGFNTGLARVQIRGRTSVFNEHNGPPPGTVDSWGRLEGRVYAGCSDGLYQLQPADPETGESARFNHLDLGVNNVFFIQEHGGESLFTGRGHLYRLENGTGNETPRAVSLLDLEGAVPFHAAFSKVHPDRLYIPTLQGFAVAEKVDGSWVLLENNTDLGYTRRLVEQPDGTLWLSSYTIGFVHVEPPVSGDWKEARYTVYKNGKGLPDDVIWTEIYEDVHGPYFFTDKGSRRWDSLTGRFVPDIHYSDESGSPVSVKPLVRTPRGDVWGSRYRGSVRDAETPFGHYRTDSSGRHRWHPSPPAVLGEIGFAGVAEMHLEPTPGQPVLWARGYHHMLRVDLSQPALPPVPWETRIHRLEGGGTRIHPLPEEQLVLPYSREPLLVELAAPQFSRGEAIRFQHRLQGFNSRWSEPVDSPVVRFTNLEGGPFVFEARAIDRAGAVSEPVRFSFRVRPPWHRSGIAYAGYGLAAILSVGGLIRWRLQAARREHLRLESLVRDRTRDLEAATAEAREANAAKSRFLANMSHELRTPLNGILGYAQMLRRERDLPERIRERLQIVEDSGSHLLSMINEVLDLSKIEARRMERMDAPFPLAKLLDQLTASAELRAAAKGLAFSGERDQDLPDHVLGDGRKLRQILENLLDNALKFTASGEIRFTASMNGGWLAVQVADSGPGIPSGDQASVFEAFAQASAIQPTTGQAGTGLGLPLAKAYCHLMGGSLELDSTPGKGSTFTVRVPLAGIDDFQALEIPSQSEISGYQGQRRQLLIVDDIPLNRRILRDLLEPLGFDIREARTRAETLQLLQSESFDALLLDLRLPDGNALETVPDIKRQLPGMPILALSASVLQLSPEDILRAGCDGFLGKPFRAEELLQRLGQLLNISWIEMKPDPAESAPSLPTGIRIPGEDLESLLAMARSGDVVALRQHLQELSRSEADGSRLQELLEPALRRYQMTEVRRLLQRLSQSGSIPRS